MYDKYHSLVTSSYNIPTNVQLCFWFSIPLAMNSLLAQYLRPHSISSMQDDVLIKELFLSHDPDGRRLDSEQVLRAMENIMCYATASEVPVSLCSHLQCYLFFFLLKFKDVHSLRLQELKCKFCVFHHVMQQSTNHVSNTLTYVKNPNMQSVFDVFLLYFFLNLSSKLSDFP